MLLKDFLGEIFEALLRTVGLATHDSSERVQAMAVLLVSSLFAVVAGVFTSGWAATVLLAAAGLCGLLCLLVGFGGAAETGLRRVRKEAEHMATASGIVANGYGRACAALEPEIRAAVAAEYAERLQKASALGRLWLKWVMKREIERRIHEKAPPDALY